MDSLIRSDYKSARIIPARSSIASVDGWPQGYSHLKSWCLEVSDDGDLWTEVHRWTNNNDLNGPGLIGTFNVTKSVKSRFVRRRQIGKNHANHDFLCLSGFEIFGALCAL
jgi:hypothetical protein